MIAETIIVQVHDDTMLFVWAALGASIGLLLFAAGLWWAHR